MKVVVLPGPHGKLKKQARGHQDRVKSNIAMEKLDSYDANMFTMTFRVESDSSIPGTLSGKYDKRKS